MTGCGCCHSHTTSVLSATVNTAQSDKDQGRGEAVIEFELVEKNLQRAEADGDQDQPEIIELQAAREHLPALLDQQRRLGDENRDQGERDQPDRQVDEEDPVPGQIIRQPAADAPARSRGRR